MIKSALRIGITGGIGAGKTTVSRLFSVYGVPVYRSDERAKWLIENDYTLMASIIELLGREVYRSDGSYDRGLVASLVFENPVLLARLNALVHPMVRRDANNWHLQQKGQAYTIQEAAMLKNSDWFAHLEGLILVKAPKDLRIARVLSRDNVSEAQVLARMNMQLAEAETEKLAQYVVINDGLSLLLPQVQRLHHTFMSLYEQM